MSPTADCIALVKSFEQCRLKAYDSDGAHVPTIGWGHTRGVRLGDTCTQEQADAWLVEELQEAADEVLRLVKVNLTQGEFGALTAFVYNIGGPAFSKSTLLKLLNQGDAESAASQFLKWSFAKGAYLEGLHRRRLTEQALFLKGA